LLYGERRQTGTFAVYLSPKKGEKAQEMKEGGGFDSVERIARVESTKKVAVEGGYFLKRFGETET